jgi:DNA-binding transcriptional regulator YhcF (GntR family)
LEEKRLLPVNLDSFKPLRELVLDAIREAIINGSLKPRERLMELQLAEELGVSVLPFARRCANWNWKGSL